jgi:hypothetical protein
MSSLHTAEDATLQGLPRLLKGLDVTRFLESGLGEEMLYRHGEAEDWEDLFTWHDLNRVLNTGVVAYPRVRLVQAGSDIAASGYTYERGGRRWPESGACQKRMSEGATLIMEAVDGVNPRLDVFLRTLERDFGTAVHADVVATCAAVPALTMHWDEAECFNLQLTGQKQWKVTRPERLYPLTPTKRFPDRHDTNRPLPPEGMLTWTGILSPGDLLYLPRGWWHAVTPCEVPSLHLSIAVDFPTLSDFVRWYARRLTEFETARRILPCWPVGEETLARFSPALAAITEGLNVKTLAAYLAVENEATVDRPHFALPGAATLMRAGVSSTTMVRLRAALPLRWTREGTQLILTWRDREMRFDERILPAVHQLNSMAACSVSALSQSASPLLIHAFVMALLSADVATLVEQ